VPLVAEGLSLPPQSLVQPDEEVALAEVYECSGEYE